jgi:probable phosphoglycerate mutase
VTTIGPTEFIVVRHSETAWNVQHRFQGHQDSTLTPLGLRQAEAVAERLAAEQFQALYASDLPRAMRTAEAIARRTGRPIIPDPRLRERNYGAFEGLTAAEIAERFPEDHRRFFAPDLLQPVPDGETRRDKFLRVTTCFEDLAHRHSSQRVVVVTHGGVLGDLLRRSLSMPLEQILQCSLQNASLNSFLIQDGRWTLGTWGDVEHLRTIGSHLTIAETDT